MKYKHQSYAKQANIWTLLECKFVKWAKTHHASNIAVIRIAPYNDEKVAGTLIW